MTGALLTFLSIVIAALAMIVSASSYRVAKSKLNLDLFDRRIEVFEATWLFLNEAATARGEVSDVAQLRFNKATVVAPFLFGTKVSDYMKTARLNVDEFRIVATTANTMYPDLAQPGAAEDRLLLGRWLHAQASTGCHGVFLPYLDFSRWNTPVAKA